MQPAANLLKLLLQKTPKTTTGRIRTMIGVIKKMEFDQGKTVSKEKAEKVKKWRQKQ